MSVDYNELYQEFILLSSSPSVSSSSPSPPLRNYLYNNNINNNSKNPSPINMNINSIQQRLPDSGSPPVTDHSLITPLTQSSSSSTSSSSFNNNNNNQHPHYNTLWSQQQLHNFPEKRKDLNTSPASPTEPPAKKQAFKDGQDPNNNNNNNINNSLIPHKPNTSSSSLQLPPTSGCIVTSIHSHSLGQESTSHFPRVNQAIPDDEEGTSCIVIHKGPPLNELRRLLTTPVGPGSRSSSYTDPSQSSYIQHSSNFYSSSAYPTQMNGQHLQALASGGQDCWMQHPSQNQIHHQNVPEVNTSQQNISSGQQQSNEPIEEVVKFNPWLANSETPIFPGGLEVLWKELPEECQKLITPQDVPDSARFRGYFTVCELLTLKRNLKSRHNSSGGLPPMRLPPPSASAVAAAAAAAQADEIMNAGVGVAVKEALDVLEEEEQHQQQQSGSNGGGNEMIQQPAVNNSIIHHSEGNPGLGNESKLYMNTTPEIKHVIPPPPYRTSTLVLKLLQIGNYSFRSFSESNPNRLKVLYNSQRLTYECHLPSVQSRDSSQFQRRILTIDVNFDQIVDIKFGCDKMTLQVDGTPVFTVSHNLANEVPHALTLTPHDQNLLEQIDQGLLKLTPIHQLFFINERLVHNLESQLREHPRFRHLLTQNQSALHGR